MSRVILTVLVMAVCTTAFAQKRVAVLPLTNKAGLTNAEKQYLTDTVRGIAVDGLQNTNMVVINRANMEVLLGPNKTMNECVGSCAVDTAKNLQAHYVVTGELVKVFGGFRLSLRAHASKTGQMLKQLRIKINEKRDFEARVELDSPPLFEMIRRHSLGLPLTAIDTTPNIIRQRKAEMPVVQRETAADKAPTPVEAPAAAASKNALLSQPKSAEPSAIPSKYVSISMDAVIEDWTNLARSDDSDAQIKQRLFSKYTLMLKDIESVKDELASRDASPEVKRRFSRVFKLELSEIMLRTRFMRTYTLEKNQLTYILKGCNAGDCQAIKGLTLQEGHHYGIEKCMDLDGDSQPECVVSFKFMGNAAMSEAQDYFVGGVVDNQVVRFDVPYSGADGLDGPGSYQESTLVYPAPFYAGRRAFGIKTTKNENKTWTRYFQYQDNKVTEVGSPWYQNGMEANMAATKAKNTDEKQRKLREASNAFKMCLKMFPGFPDCLVGLGWIEWRHKKWSSVVELWDQAKKQDPNRTDVDAFLNQARQKAK